MAFAVRVGTDLFRTKHNVRAEFSGRPTMMELINAVESQYDTLSRAVRPPGHPDVPFKVETMQVYDEILQRWVDLYSGAQLSPGCQVFCFQPESGWHSDCPDVIPDTTGDDVTWTSAPGSPKRAERAEAEPEPPCEERIRAVFDDMSNRRGYVLYSDLRRGLKRCGVEFTVSNAGEMFAAADRNRDGQITFTEWVSYSTRHPKVVDALYFRLQDAGRDEHAAPPSVTRPVPALSPAPGSVTLPWSPEVRAKAEGGLAVPPVLPQAGDYFEELARQRSRAEAAAAMVAAEQGRRSAEILAEITAARLARSTALRRDLGPAALVTSPAHAERPLSPADPVSSPGRWHSPARSPPHPTRTA
eukprot:TRINITY_DN29099_c0_g1_i1.p1 TRINITY_DN29099_c0_g1~~TRINITY_DN29099_c0_g1_i1.p1  ORF type:complete len:379 (+),score=87.06 TRINITY_DN29099_c0_g1_i1:64-1137(+)